MRKQPHAELNDEQAECLKKQGFISYGQQITFSSCSSASTLVRYSFSDKAKTTTTTKKDLGDMVDVMFLLTFLSLGLFIPNIHVDTI